ncbi:MAG: hypothetical protein ACPGJS_06560 [Flammeovirgaceae bacterium]
MINLTGLKISFVAIGLLEQLKDLIHQLDQEQYTVPLAVLSQSTIGQHYRHCLEFFDCMLQGLDTGVIAYDKRQREERLNVDMEYVLERIDAIIYHISTAEDQPIELEASYPCSEVTGVRINTSLLRELHYNIEHLVHHMAIIKIGVKENFKHVALNPSFGISESTIAYHQQ